MPSDIQWIVGFVIAGAVVVVVVALVGTIIYLASQIKGQVQAINAALRDAEGTTAALWKGQELSQTTLDILAAVTKGRLDLEGGNGS